MNREEILKSMLASNPGDSFARYGLAMEYVKSGALDQAVGEFQNLLAANPKYVAAYFHGGQTLEKLGRLDEARDIYKRGITVAGETGDLHARGEMEGALDLLG